MNQAAEQWKIRDGTSPLQTRRSTLAQILAVLIKNSFLVGHGMMLAFPTLLIPALSGNDSTESFALGQEGLSWIGSIGFMFTTFGCLISGFLMQAFGRKRSMQFITLIFMASWLLLYYSWKVWHIFAALIITGLCGGIMEAPAITYVAEIAQPHLRGALTTTTTISSTIGVMIQFILGPFLNWRTIALYSAIYSVFCFGFIFFLPETPIWLLSKKRKVEAKRNLAWLRGWVTLEDVEDEYNNVVTLISQNFNINRRKFSKIKLIQQANFLKPFALVSYLFFLRHFSGITPLQTFSVNIFKTFQVPIGKYYATTIFGITSLLGCAIFLILVYHYGKRRLALISLSGTALGLFILAIYAETSRTKYLVFKNSNHSLSESKFNDELRTFSWIPLVVIILVLFLSRLGIRALPWMLIGEIFPTDIKFFACGMSAAVAHILGFLCNKFFLKMVSNLTLPGTFLFFSSVGGIGFLVLYFLLPETERRTLQEITDHFSGKIKLGNKLLENH